MSRPDPMPVPLLRNSAFVLKQFDCPVHPMGSSLLLPPPLPWDLSGAFSSFCQITSSQITPVRELQLMSCAEKAGVTPRIRLTLKFRGKYSCCEMVSIP